jgi:ATP-dependent RNA helicase RhlE
MTNDDQINKTGDIENPNKEEVVETLDGEEEIAAEAIEDEIIEEEILEDSDEESEEQESSISENFVTNIDWKELGLSEPMIQVLKEKGFQYPTEVQAKAIPVLLQKKDVVVYSSSGSGKKASFAIPMIESLAGRQELLGLVLAPHFETAAQIEGVFRIFGEPRSIVTKLVSGNEQDTQSLNGVNVVIATLDSLLSLIEKNLINLSSIEMVVIDELDRFFNNAITEPVTESAVNKVQEQLKVLFEKLQTRKQTVVITSLPTPRVLPIIEAYLKTPEEVKVGIATVDLEKAHQKLYFMQVSAKLRELKKIFDANQDASMIIFVRSKDSALRLTQKLISENICDTAMVHADLEEQNLNQVLSDYASKKYRALIVTDNVGKKLNFENTLFLINYDLPLQAEEYVARIGRISAPNGEKLKVVNFVTPYDERALNAIENILGIKLEEEFTEGCFIPDNYVPRNKNNKGRRYSNNRQRGGSSRGRSSNRYGRRR